MQLDPALETPNAYIFIGKKNFFPFVSWNSYIPSLEMFILT